MQSSLQSKVDQIRAGATRKTDLGVKQNKNVIQGKGAKFIVEEKEKNSKKPALNERKEITSYMNLNSAQKKKKTSKKSKILNLNQNQSQSRFQSRDQEWKKKFLLIRDV